MVLVDVLYKQCNYIHNDGRSCWVVPVATADMSIIIRADSPKARTPSHILEMASPWPPNQRLTCPVARPDEKAVGKSIEVGAPFARNFHIEKSCLLYKIPRFMYEQFNTLDPLIHTFSPQLHAKHALQPTCNLVM